MYTSVIGKKFLARVNQAGGTNYTPKSFFDEVYYPLFFDNARYLIWLMNSPFCVAKGKPQDETWRAEQLNKLHLKIAGGATDASIAFGFPAEDELATTSGLVSTLQVPLQADEIYSSWFGASLGVRVSGGLILLFEEPEILQLLYEGWTKYRGYLTEVPALKGNQIETWNGQWLTFALNNTQNQYASFIPGLNSKSKTTELATQSWIKLLFALARRYPNRPLTCYVYSLGQTNKTIGFIRLQLPEVKREIDIYTQLFGKESGLTARGIDDVYITEFGFPAVCRHGAIGLRQIEPKSLKEFIAGGRKADAAIKLTTEESKINFIIYLSWIIAMLNDKTLLIKAEETATALLAYERANKRTTTSVRKVEQLLNAESRRKFIEGLTTILSDGVDNPEFINDLVNCLDALPADKYTYFATLIKFKYAFLKSNKQN